MSKNREIIKHVKAADVAMLVLRDTMDIRFARYGYTNALGLLAEDLNVKVEAMPRWLIYFLEGLWDDYTKNARPGYGHLPIILKGFSFKSRPKRLSQSR